MKNSFLFIFLFLVASSCQNVAVSDTNESTISVQETDTHVDMHTSRISLDWSGTYLGTLPCADCPGIDITIELNDDNTFVERLHYLEKEEGNFTDSGKIEWHENGNVITLLSKDGAKQQYKVKEGSLVLLNQGGEENLGSLAKHYVLLKQQ